MRDKHEPNMDLYFIALVPPRELREVIRKIKERMKDEYGAGHALKSPAHITLQMPFKRNLTDEAEISDALRRFALPENKFTVDLNGYGAFVPRVIFIKISHPEPVRALHKRLTNVLLSELHFSPGEVLKDMQPHVTIATRDLTKEAFSEAWPVVQDEDFSASFDVHSIFLLKHNGRNWDIMEEYPFR
jgi:2'-5' RNA ligase